MATEPETMCVLLRIIANELFIARKDRENQEATDKGAWKLKDRSLIEEKIEKEREALKL